MFYSPFKHSIYRSVWIVLFFSNIGTWVHTVTSSLLMTKLTNSSSLIALVQTFSVLPILIFSIPAGVIADLYNRKTVVISAQILMSLVAWSMAYITYVGEMNALLLLTMTFMLNVGFAFNQPAWHALSSTLVPTADIKQAAALNNLNFNVSRCIGPAIAGWFFSTLSPAFLFALNGFSFFGVIYIFSTKLKFQSSCTHAINFQQIQRGFTEAVGFFKEFTHFPYIIIKSFSYFSLASCLWAILPYFIIIDQHFSDKELGLLISGAGIGAVLNAYYIYYLRKYLSDASLTTLAFILVAVVMFLLIILHSLYLYFVVMIIFGLSWSLTVSVFNGILQAEFPVHTRSRLIGVYFVFFALAQVLGSFLSGKAIQLWGVNHTLLTIGVVTLFFGCHYTIRATKYSVTNREV